MTDNKKIIHTVNCNCGDMHHQHHDHHTHHDINCTCTSCADQVPIYISSHEGALVASFEKSTAQPLEELTNILSESMRRLSVTIRQNGGLVGHIKAIIKSGGHTCMLSLTKNEVSIKCSGDKSENLPGISFAAIAVNVGETLLCKELKEIYEKL